jgi:hypothetical protein
MVSMLDFTLKIYHDLLERLSVLSHLPFAAFLENGAADGFVLRHDVDKLPGHSLAFARLQQELGARGSYYFRIVPESFDPGIIEEIAGMGHEIGYHYEDLSLVEREMKREKGKGGKEKGRAVRRLESGNRKKQEREEFEVELFERGILSFERNLTRLRQYADIKTICMHGSPLSKWDSRLLWDRYDYRDYGIVGEPYFDIDFGRVAYYTDTGRRWDGEAVSVRDKAMKKEQTKVVRQKWKEEEEQTKVVKQKSKEEEEQGTGDRKPEAGAERFPRFHSTFEIIDAIERGEFPVRAMMTFHPQRWTDNAGLWVKELVLQNVKNGVKKIIVRSRE